MRIVLDSNAILSGLMSARGAPGKLLDLWLEGHFTLVTSRYQVAELQRVSAYPRIQTRLQSSDLSASFSLVESRSTPFEMLPEVHASPDPKDDPILATALAGQADLIVTGDKRDLLELVSFRGIKIIDPATALRRLVSG